MLEAFEKTPAAVLRHGVDLQSWLTPRDVVVAATAELVDPNGAVELAEPERRRRRPGAHPAAGRRARPPGRVVASRRPPVLGPEN